MEDEDLIVGLDADNEGCGRGVSEEVLNVEDAGRVTQLDL
jgi:hypothetical protein